MVVGRAPSMVQLLEQMRATVASGLDVLLTGETGTGKELFAKMIHSSGPSGKGPFVAINCAAIPSELLEAELFGVHKGAATGVEPRPGRFLQADGGTLLLDEVGELTAVLQAKLLRVVQEREVLSLGAPATRKDPRPDRRDDESRSHLPRQRGVLSSRPLPQAQRSGVSHSSSARSQGRYSGARIPIRPAGRG